MLRRGNLAEFHLSELLNALNESSLSFRVEGYADAFLSGAAGSSSSVNVGVDVLGRIALDNQVDLGKIQPSGGDVGGDQTFEFAALEAFEANRPLLLRDVAVQRLGFGRQLGLEDDFVAVPLGLAKDDSSAMPAAMDSHDVADGPDHFVFCAGDSVMFDCGRCLSLGLSRVGHLVLFDEVDVFPLRRHVLFGEVSHPRGDGSAEEEHLGLLGGSLVEVLEDFLDVFLEAEIEHLICFVKYEGVDC